MIRYIGATVVMLFLLALGAGAVPFGGDDAGEIPADAPRGPIAKCENGVGKAVAKLAAAILKCHAHRVSGKLADDSAEDTCETAAKTKFMVTKTTGCAACTDLAALATAVETLVDGNNDKVYCTASGTAFGGDDAGTIPADAPRGPVTKCENRVGSAVGKLIANVVKCHAARVAGKTTDDTGEDACEDAAQTKFGATKTTGCDPCTNLTSLGTFIETAVDGANGAVYCAAVTTTSTTTTSTTTTSSTSTTSTTAPACPYVTQWDAHAGSDTPDVAVDGSGNVFVAGAGTSTVQVFANDGTSLGEFNIADGEGIQSPQGIAVYGTDVFVADRSNHNVKKFTSTGTLITKWGTAGSADGQFAIPMGVAVDASENVYVTDQVNDRVQVFDSTGSFIRGWGTLFGGDGDGDFKGPSGIAVDATGNVFVADTRNNRVQKFMNDATFVTSWSVISPVGVAVDGSGNVFVTNTEDRQVQKFDNDGTLLYEWGTRGHGNGQFDTGPGGVAVDAGEHVFTGDGDARVQKFSCP